MKIEKNIKMKNALQNKKLRYLKSYRNNKKLYKINLK